MSGKISWPCDTSVSPKFPLYMIHKDLQDKDFHLVKTGDPVFVKQDGSVITYDGSYGDAIYFMFVNEGGYYYASSGTGIGVAIATMYDVATGTFVPCQEDPASENYDSEICDF